MKSCIFDQCFLYGIIEKLYFGKHTFGTQNTYSYLFGKILSTFSLIQIHKGFYSNVVVQEGGLTFWWFFINSNGAFVIRDFGFFLNVKSKLIQTEILQYNLLKVEILN